MFDTIVLIDDSMESSLDKHDNFIDNYAAFFDALSNYVGKDVEAYILMHRGHSLYHFKDRMIHFEGFSISSFEPSKLATKVKMLVRGKESLVLLDSTIAVSNNDKDTSISTIMQIVDKLSDKHIVKAVYTSDEDLGIPTDKCIALNNFSFKIPEAAAEKFVSMFERKVATA